MPVILGSVGAAIELGMQTSDQRQLQLAADAAALTGAKYLSLADAKRENIPSVVVSIIATYVDIATEHKRTNGAVVTTLLSDNPLRLDVTVTKTVPTILGRFLGRDTATTAAHSAATIVGSPNLCLLALETGAPGAISLDNGAEVEGRNCSVFSNSRSNAGLKANGNSTMRASLVCSAGGQSGKKDAFEPEPMLDCPGFDDPLADRPEPAVEPCKQTKLVIDGGSISLEPGTYCGGLTITNGADVHLQEGIYTIKDGPLTIDRDSRMTGEGVGFYLTGDGAVLNIDGPSTVSLEASMHGAMAGLLFFESRGQSAKAKHKLLSDNAQIMVGTIYLPSGKLWIGGNSRVGGESAYTAIVARSIELTDGPKVILNSDFDRTNVPVPDGIRHAGQPAVLVN